MRIYTKTGDDGTTGLIGGTRVKKYHVRLEAYGTVDELNCAIGLLLTVDLEARSRRVLQEVQARLFVIGSQLATDDRMPQKRDKIPCREEDILLLEREMDDMSESLPPLSHFILPGGSTGAAYAHLARVVCRRAERRIVELSDQETVDPLLIRYVNRLSDFFFVLSRKINNDKQVGEILWMGHEKDE